MGDAREVLVRDGRAVAFDLVQEAADKASGSGWAVAGLFAGCAVFFGGDALIDRMGRRRMD